MSETENEKSVFDHWCVVELMGHQRIAGRVTEANLFGGALMRVDVPDVDGRTGYSKFFGANAIYAVTPVEEVVARAMAKSFDTRPVEEWRLRNLLPQPEYSAVDEDNRPDRDYDNSYDEDEENHSPDYDDDERLPVEPEEFDYGGE